MGTRPDRAARRSARRLITEHHLASSVIPAAHLAALAIEHGVGVCSADTDFAGFSGLQWFNPLDRAGR